MGQDNLSALEKFENVVKTEENDFWMHKDDLLGCLEVIKKDSTSVELPAIPQFVADWLGYHKTEGNCLGEAMQTHYEDDREMHTWLYGDIRLKNDETFAMAWLFGYTIEESKEYTVILPVSVDGYAYTYLDNAGELIAVDTLAFLGELTEEEIKAVDESFWRYAKEVVK